MITNNELKKLKEIIEDRNEPVVVHRGTIAVSFHAAGKYCWFKLKLNICLRIRIKIPEQLFVIMPGISSSATYLESFSLLMALQTPASEVG
jgi:hypothetical protein